MMIISELKSQMNKTKLSQYMGISRASIYYKRHEPVNRSRISEYVEGQIIELSKERITYGYRRIWAMLRNSGIRINAKTVYKVMKRHSLTLKRNEHKGRKSRKDLTKPKGPNELWEMDITYISTKKEGMLYLFNIKDCFTKEWIAYLLTRTCNRRDAVKALEEAYIEAFPNGKVEGLVLRTDNGPQFRARSFKEAVKILGMKQEYIEKSTPEDNGDIESFHGSIKADYIWPYEYEDYEEVEKSIKEAYKDYNTVRPHSTIGYLPPKEFKKRWEEDEKFREKYEEKINRKVRISVS